MPADTQSASVTVSVEAGIIFSRTASVVLDCFLQSLPLGGQDRPESLREPLNSGQLLVSLRGQVTCRLFDWVPFKAENQWSQREGSNLRPADYESAALPTELRWRLEARLR